MEQEPEPFFLFIGSGDRDSATSKLRHSGVRYRKKMMESSPVNWAEITELLNDANLAGALVKLTSTTSEYLVHENYSIHAPRLLQALSNVRHLVFVHQSILTGKSTAEQSEESDRRARIREILLSQELYDTEELEFFIRRQFLDPPPEPVRRKLPEIFRKYDLNIAPYTRNYELSILASAFIEDSEKKLLFRIYIPTGRIWAAEADRLISLFRDWLSQVKSQKIRQDGYRTDQGAVYEFYGDGALDSDELSRELQAFSDFLELCVTDSSAAQAVLERERLSDTNTQALIGRYAKAARRLSIDIRHERESRLLLLRQQLESELLETDVGSMDVAALASRLVPVSPGPGGLLVPRIPGLGLDHRASIVVNQQFIGTVRGAVAAHLTGDINFGAEPRQLLELVAEYGGARRAELESAVHELEDADAKPGDRMSAKQRLQSFLLKVGTQLGERSLTVLQAYVEAKLGL